MKRSRFTEDRLLGFCGRLRLEFVSLICAVSMASRMRPFTNGEASSVE